MNQNIPFSKPFENGRVFQTLLLPGLLGIALLGVACDSVSGSGQAYSPTATLLVQVVPTAPSTMPELIAVLTAENNDAARISALAALARMGPEAAPAVPAIIDNLSHNNSEVRERAVTTLGEIGPEAADAVPGLLDMLLDDPNINVRRRIPDTLSWIGNVSAVPYLAGALFDEDVGVAMNAAESLATLTALDISDLPPHQANSDGVPLIVAAAREWWEEEGQFQDWTD